MNSKINAIIIDDEDTFVSSLSLLIKNNFNEINIVDKVATVKQAILSIKKHKPELLFLDINLPDGTGFDLLEKIAHRNFEVIFTTSHSEYAVRAFEFSALHYLTKPIDLQKLKVAVERFSKFLNKETSLDEKLNILKQSLLDKPQKIILPSADGSNIYNLSDIVWCEAQGGYSKVHFINGKPLTISKSLNKLVEMLNDLDFVRIHQSHLINLKYLTKFINTRYAKVVLVNNVELEISNNNKDLFRERLKTYAKSF